MKRSPPSLSPRVTIAGMIVWYGLLPPYPRNLISVISNSVKGEKLTSTQLG